MATVIKALFRFNGDNIDQFIGEVWGGVINLSLVTAKSESCFYLDDS